MKRRILPVLLAVCLLLSGCSSWMDGSHYFVEPHSGQGYRSEEGVTPISNYLDIQKALTGVVENGLDSITVSAAAMSTDNLSANINMAIQYISNNNPIGAYAVEKITYEIGTTGGVTACVITVTYNQNRSEIKRIRQVDSMNSAKKLIHSALDRMDNGVILKISNYRHTDYIQLVEDYARENPDKVMELPKVSASVYPNIGTVRVVELNFTYQTSRDSLKQMQSYVQPVFTSAELYVQGEDNDAVKYSRLYGFLMETTDYTVETSMTPAYSLLRHGVGDSRAFATVYAAMCKKAGLECLTVSGTKDGEPRFWNIIREGETYYHLDLLQSYLTGGYQKLSDAEMVDYVWDYATYPVCGVIEEAKEEEVAD